MISVYDVISAFERNINNGEKLPFTINKENNNVYDSNTGELICSLETYVEHIRKKLHCNFESIYSEHVSLFNVIRCIDCGAVIFTYDDEDYDPNLSCPCCGGYETSFKWYSAEDIENDSFKKDEIKYFEGLTELELETDKRIEKRGLYDWQVWKKTFYGKKKYLAIEIQADNFPKTKLKGLFALIRFGSKDKDEVGYSINKVIHIPLSPKMFYIYFIFPYKKSAPQDMRKYLPWQKKFENK